MDKYINTFYKENIKRYNYEIRGIKDEIGESITSKVFRNDAIIFVDKIIRGKSFKQIVSDNAKINIIINMP